MLINECTAIYDLEWLVKTMKDHGGEYQLLSLVELTNILNAVEDIQRPVKPFRVHSGGGTTWWNVCGNCSTAINPNAKFCHQCGKGVLWDGREQRGEI